MFGLKSADDLRTAAWLQVVVKKALPLDLFDDPLFREAVAVTAKHGKVLLGAHQVLELPKRTKITEKVLPKLDAELDEKIRNRMSAVVMLTGATIISDGWSSCANRPILNALASSPLGTYFIKATDTSGDTKDAKYIADFIIDVIKQYGPERVTAVCMDGACKSSFARIEKEYPHVPRQWRVRLIRWAPGSLHLPAQVCTSSDAAHQDAGGGDSLPINLVCPSSSIWQDVCDPFYLRQCKVSVVVPN
eukprot:scaffold8133_cov110-Isochrysis_galbana.AAC.1